MQEIPDARSSWYAPATDITETRDHGQSIGTSVNIEHFLNCGNDGFCLPEEEQRCRVINDNILGRIRDEFPGLPEKGNDNAEPLEEIEFPKGSESRFAPEDNGDVDQPEFLPCRMIDIDLDPVQSRDILPFIAARVEDRIACKYFSGCMFGGENVICTGIPEIAGQR